MSKRKLGHILGHVRGTDNGHVPDTNNNDNNIYYIYIILLNKYKSKIQNSKFSEKVKVISELKKENDYNNLDYELQEKLFMELMSLKSKI